MLMERAGTGGALFRNFYRDFLEEAHQITELECFHEAAQAFTGIAQVWTEIAKELEQAGTQDDISHIKTASQLLLEVAALEKAAMETLFQAVKKI